MKPQRISSGSEVALDLLPHFLIDWWRSWAADLLLSQAANPESDAKLWTSE